MESVCWMEVQQQGAGCLWLTYSRTPTTASGSEVVTRRVVLKACLSVLSHPQQVRTHHEQKHQINRPKNLFPAHWFSFQNLKNTISAQSNHFCPRSDTSWCPKWKRESLPSLIKEMRMLQYVSAESKPQPRREIWAKFSRLFGWASESCPTGFGWFRKEEPLWCRDSAVVFRSPLATLWFHTAPRLNGESSVTTTSVQEGGVGGGSQRNTSTQMSIVPSRVQRVRAVC